MAPRCGEVNWPLTISHIADGDVGRVEGRWVVRHTWCVGLDRVDQIPNH
jgi:hypothetical protein